MTLLNLIGHVRTSAKETRPAMHVARQCVILLFCLAVRRTFGIGVVQQSLHCMISDSVFYMQSGNCRIVVLSCAE